MRIQPLGMIAMGAALIALIGCSMGTIQTYQSDISAPLAGGGRLQAAGGEPIKDGGLTISFLQVAYMERFQFIRVVAEFKNTSNQEITVDPAMMEVENPVDGSSWVHPKKGDPNARKPPIGPGRSIRVNILYTGVKMKDVPKSLRAVWRTEKRDFVLGLIVPYEEAQKVFEAGGTLDLL